VELLPAGKDPFSGMLMIKYLAMIAAWVGEKDLACEQIIIVVRSPTGGLDLSYGELKLMPFWDPLRGEPCFEEIVASLAPKEKASSKRDSLERFRKCGSHQPACHAEHAVWPATGTGSTGGVKSRL